MADLIKKIKIKQQDGTFTDYIPIGAEAKNIDMKNDYSVQANIGDIDVDNDGSIAEQLNKNKNDISNLQINKINKTDIIDNLESEDSEKPLSAKQGKILNEKIEDRINISKSLLNNLIYMNGSDN